MFLRFRDDFVPVVGVLALSVAAGSCDRSPSEDRDAALSSPPSTSESVPLARGDDSTARIKPDESDEEPSVPEKALPEPRVISLGTTLDETIASPQTLDSPKLEYETDWYALEGRPGRTVRISVRPAPGSRLQPMVTVLLPDRSQPDEWRELDARRGTEPGLGIDLTVTFEREGTKLVTVDDARNLPAMGAGGPPDSYRGGPDYGYTIEFRNPDRTDAAD